jgi:hypothetical protein
MAGASLINPAENRHPTPALQKPFEVSPRLALSFGEGPSVDCWDLVRGS